MNESSQLNESSLFLSSCSRRELARRRTRVALPALVVPGLIALSCMLAVAVVLLVLGHGTL